MAALDVLPSECQPFFLTWVAGELEQPTQQCHAVTTAEAEPDCLWIEGIGEGAGVVENAADGVRNHLSDGTWIFSVIQKVRGCARRARNQQAVTRHVLTASYSSPVEANIRATRLSPRRKCEFMAIGRQMTEAVHSRG